MFTVVDDIPTSSPISYPSHTDNKGIFKDKREAIEAFKDFLKEKVKKKNIYG